MPTQESRIQTITEEVIKLQATLDNLKSELAQLTSSQENNRLPYYDVKELITKAYERGVADTEDAVTSHSYDYSYSNHLMNIEIEIRGDEFWSDIIDDSETNCERAVELILADYYLALNKRREQQAEPENPDFFDLHN